jgi:hypothetical protein
MRALKALLVFLALSEGLQRNAICSVSRRSGLRKGRMTRVLQPLQQAEKDTPQIDVVANIARLRSMAAQLKAEASELELVVQKERLAAVSEAFSDFDTNNDGSISVEELRIGLVKVLKDVSVSEDLAKKLLAAFDESGDGAIQLNEFKGVEAFKQKIEGFLREERDAALQAEAQAKEAKAAAELEELRAEALAQFLNDGPPSISDRFVSLLPYLFPLLDSIQYGRFLINTELDNPLVASLTALYRVYENIPFSGLIAFFALSTMSNNMKLNRLIRFNIQQAILLDIALVVPGILGGMGKVISPDLGDSPPAIVVGSTITFFVISVPILYSIASSLAGITPDKIPLISERVENRVPTAAMFDEEGRLIPREERERRKRENEEK